MLHRIGKSTRSRTGCHEQDRNELLRLALGVERMLATRSKKVSPSGRHDGPIRQRSRP